MKEGSIILRCHKDGPIPTFPQREGDQLTNLVFRSIIIIFFINSHIQGLICTFAYFLICTLAHSLISTSPHFHIFTFDH